MWTGQLFTYEQIHDYDGHDKHEAEEEEEGDGSIGNVGAAVAVVFRRVREEEAVVVELANHPECNKS